MFALAMADGKKKVCRWRVVCRGEKGEWVKEIVASVWSVGAKRASGSRELSVACGLSGENAAWVKKASGVVWFSGRNRRVGQKAC